MVDVTRDSRTRVVTETVDVLRVRQAGRCSLDVYTGDDVIALAHEGRVRCGMRVAGRGHFVRNRGETCLMRGAAGSRHGDGYSGNDCSDCENAK